MTNINFNQLKDINEIVSVKDENGKELFSTSDEKGIFTDVRIEGDVDKARQVAVLFEKVKKAEVARAKDENLLDAIEKEINDKTLAYKILNSYDERVDKAFTSLGLLLKTGDKGDKTKAQIEEKVRALTSQKRDKQFALAEKKSQKRAAVDRKKEKK